MNRNHAAEDSIDLCDWYWRRHRRDAQSFFERRVLSSMSCRLTSMNSDRLYVETQRYRLPNYFGGILGKRRRDAAAEHREIMDATLRRSEDAVRLLAEHYRKTAEIIEASIDWPQPSGKAAK